ncbi:MAG TPA: PilZ domain-containing protein, partial [Gemmatimonadales bacterium]|nr:PilZ domain-containing protein [Gemmatimonadales bacterium]
RVEGGSEGTARGHTVDLSASGGRVTTDAPLVEGDVVVLELPARGGLQRLRLPALVWEAYAGGAVLVFANLAPAEFTRLQEYLASCQPRGPRARSV